MMNNLDDFQPESLSPELNLMPEIDLELNLYPAVDQSFPSLTAHQLHLSTSASSQNQYNPPTNTQTASSQAQIISFDNFLSSLRSNHFTFKKTTQISKLKLKLSRKKCRCVICQQSVKEKSVVHRLECKHTFHRQCLVKWTQVKHSCPLCRKQLK